MSHWQAACYGKLYEEGIVTEKRAEYSAGNGKAREKIANPVRRWGLDGDAVLKELQRAVVELRLADGSTATGHLVGYNEYTLTLKADDGVAVVSKGHVVAVRPKGG